MADEKRIRDAIKELRSSMGMSQIEFAVRLGKSYPTVQRYENVVAPKGPELATLVYMARKVKRHDLAKLFKDAAISVVPEELAQLIREGDIDELPEQEATTERKSHNRKLSA